MNATEINTRQMALDNLPDTEAVMASLLYVSTLYIKKPTLDLAKMALSLSEVLTMPEYAGSDLLCNVSRRMCVQWTLLVHAHEGDA